MADAKPAKPADPFAEAANLHAELGVPQFWANLAGNCETWAKGITVNAFWDSIAKSLDQWRTEYHAETGADLIATPTLPPFEPKSEKSIRDKFCRRWREKHANLFPAAGPPIPQLGDLVRTRIVCRYLDGVEFLATKIEAEAKSAGVLVSRVRQGSLQGYFAQHVGIKQSVFYRLAGVDNPIQIECEIQIATIVATRMWDESHPVYEGVRQEDDQSQEWQWKPSDPKFLANQLGHMLQLADGLLVQLRDSLRKGRK